MKITDKFTIVFNDSQGYPAEIYSKGLTYSLLDENYKARHRPIRCKDFFQDVIWGEQKKETASIYGFSWKGDGSLLTKKKLVIGVKDEGKDIGEKAKNCQSLLNQFEKILKIPKSKCIPDSTGTAIATEFSIKWTEVPYIFSLFTLMLRAGLGYNNEPLEEFFTNAVKNQNIPMNDRNYINQGLVKIKELLKGVKRPQTYEQYGSVSQIHNYSGIVNFN
jgi:hypothetical protein